MQVDYIHGNPSKGNLRIKKPTMSSVAAKLSKAVASNPSKNPVKKTSAKKIVKTTKKSTSKPKQSASSKITLEEAKALFSKPAKKSQGGTTMAVKKAHKKVAKAHKKVAKKAHKKVHAAKKVVAKKKVTAKKKPRSAAQKAATKRMLLANKAARKSPAKKHAKKVSKYRKGVSALRHAVAMKKHAKSAHTSKGHEVYGVEKNTRNTKLPMPVRNLGRGETVAIKATRITKRKVKGGKSRYTAKVYSGKITRDNPKKKRNPIVVSKNPIVVSNPKKHKKHAKKRNPVSFMKNPMGAMVGFDSKVVSMLAPVNSITEKFLNVGVLEIIGLGVGASLDGMLHTLVKKIPKSDLVLAHIPEEYQAPAITAIGGLILHGLNAFIGKKAGKKSVVIDELSKGMIAASLVKAFASMSKFSSENTALAGYQYTPAMSGNGMNGYIHSNPSASMSVGKSDFSGADFQGADFQGASHSDNVGGADFDGYVTTMGDGDSMDFGSDSSSLSGNW